MFGIRFHLFEWTFLPVFAPLHNFSRFSSAQASKIDYFSIRVQPFQFTHNFSVEAADFFGRAREYCQDGVRERGTSEWQSLLVCMWVCATRRLQFPSPGAQHNITMPSAEWKKEHGILYKHLHIHTKNVTKKTMNKKVSHFGTCARSFSPSAFFKCHRKWCAFVKCKKNKNAEERKNYEKIWMQRVLWSEKRGSDDDMKERACCAAVHQAAQRAAPRTFLL